MRKSNDQADAFTEDKLFDLLKKGENEEIVNSLTEESNVLSNSTEKGIPPLDSSRDRLDTYMSDQILSQHTTSSFTLSSQVNQETSISPKLSRTSQPLHLSHKVPSSPSPCYRRYLISSQPSLNSNSLCSKRSWGFRRNIIYMTTSLLILNPSMNG